MQDPATASANAVEAIAKTTGKALDVVHDTGGYLRQVFGKVPTDLVGVLGGAWLREQHIRIRDRLRRRTEQIIRERNLQEVIELSPNMAKALIAGAQEESREELMELWARLLANAMDPNLNSVRQLFIDAVKRMDPLDAVILRYIYEAKITVVVRGHQSEPIQNQTAGIGNISVATGRRNDDVEVSLRHLQDLSFFDAISGDAINTRWVVNPTSREFRRACYPELEAE